MVKVPVHLAEGAYTWDSQIHQYQDAPPPDTVPGCTYYAGVVEGRERPVDCLLWWAEVGGKPRVVGILNHYPIDFPPWEKAGNINLWVRRSHQRQGIGTALVQVAEELWGPLNWEQQRFTPSGAALTESILSRRPSNPNK